MATLQVNIGEARAELSELLRRVEAGDEVIVARANEPIARLVPISAVKARRQPGRLLGQIVVHDDFDVAMPELEQPFHGDPVG